MGKDMDNPDQRISEDINQFVALTLSLTIGLVRQLDNFGGIYCNFMEFIRNYYCAY